MTTILQDIRGALQAPVEAVSGFPALANRAYDGVAYQPTPGTPWARLTLLNGQRRPFSLSTSQMQSGLLQIDLFTSAKNSPGTAVIEALADRVMNAYPTSFPLVHGAARVMVNYAESMKGPDEPDWLHHIVTVSWRCFTN